MAKRPIPSNIKHQYQNNGYVLIKQLFSEQECDELIERSLALHARKSIPGCFHSVPESESDGDPLRTYPRMMHPHRVDDLSLRFLKHPRIVESLRVLLDGEAIGLQTMFYWKPPGARGQDFHQDDYYLRTEPNACIAAWMALDNIDEENGGLIVLPGSNTEDILEMCPTDTSQSFTDTAVQPPDQYVEHLIEMEKGDLLFFHGRLIHGSRPNRSSTRFRKAFICHYIPADSTSYNTGYDPIVPLN